MQYLSTRGQARQLAFDDVLLNGLAFDGGLYVPSSWPQFSEREQRQLARLDYASLALEIFRPFVGSTIPEAELERMVRETYQVFQHRAVAPLRQLENRLWMMELFHGPTLAFKDYALQLVGRLFEYVLNQRGEQVTIAGATSGDTGSAAIEASRGRARMELFILHPKGRVSEVQRRQMTSVLDKNIHNIALEGTFDDCQDQVKALFNDRAFRDEVNLSAVNSINWARVMAQIAYYFWAALSLGAPDRAIGFAVPTGNFGNIYAGFVAKKMGLNISKLIVGSNSNDILTRFFANGTMKMADVVPTYSPSMDIQISSNFERLLFDQLDRDGEAVKDLLQTFRSKGCYSLPSQMLEALKREFSAYRFDDEQTLNEVKRHYDATGELLDPHSAIGVAAARLASEEVDDPLVALATAHPAKFPEAVEKATGKRPALPEHLADLFDRKERCHVLADDTELLKAYIRKHRGGDPERPVS